MSKEFAPGRERTPEGWIKFQSDIAYRKQLFVPEVFRHPAKANLYMLEDIVEFVSEPGETILDPMSGTGSLMVATQNKFGRNVILIEEIKEYHDWQVMSSMGKGWEVGRLMPMLIHSRCQDVLPIPCDHVIFSPPYSQALHNPGGSSEMNIKLRDQVKVYTDQRNAMGKMNPFRYNMEMQKIYHLLWESIRPGGTMTIIVQDMMKGGERQPLTMRAVTMASNEGFILEEWFMRFAAGIAFKQIHKAHGDAVVENEDIVVMRRP